MGWNRADDDLHKAAHKACVHNCGNMSTLLQRVDVWPIWNPTLASTTTKSRVHLSDRVPLSGNEIAAGYTSLHTNALKRTSLLSAFIAIFVLWSIFFHGCICKVLFFILIFACLFSFQRVLTFNLFANVLVLFFLNGRKVSRSKLREPRKCLFTPKFVHILWRSHRKTET